MFVPNGRAVFGSATAIVRTDSFGQGCSNINSVKFSQVIYMTRTHLKSLDQPTQPCNQENVNVNTSACIAMFIEKQLGCKSLILGSQYSNSPQCTTKSQLMGLANYSRLLGQADGNDIHDLTRCLSSCEKDQFILTADPLERDGAYTYRGDIPCELHLQIRMMQSSYKEEEQYVIYDGVSFIADIGGYMGLLLGSSLLGIYMAMEAFMRKLFCRPFRGKLDV